MVCCVDSDWVVTSTDSVESDICVVPSDAELLGVDSVTCKVEVSFVALMSVVEGSENPAVAVDCISVTFG